jgi:hypothetical protein
MAILSFAEADAETVLLRNGTLRMIVSRAQKHVVDPADFEELEGAKPMGAISFDLLDNDQRARLTEAVYQGTLDLRQEVAEGERVSIDDIGEALGSSV